MPSRSGSTPPPSASPAPRKRVRRRPSTPNGRAACSIRSTPCAPTGCLAPTDPKLNDIRWLVGESLRRTHHRARLDQLRAVAPDRMGSTGFGPRHGLPQADVALQARDRLREAEDRVGPHAWPIVTRIVIEGAGVRDCRGFVPELATPWRADAVVSDRLRVALDMLGGPDGGHGGA